MFKPGDYVVHKIEQNRLFSSNIFLVYSVGTLTNLDGHTEDVIDVRNPNFIGKLDNASVYSLYVEPKH